MTAKLSILAASSLGGAAVLGAVRLAAQTSLTGAGATFPYPIYTKWFDAYNKKTGVQINYQSIGSGGGIRQFTEGTVDFGATDGPMTDEQLAGGRRQRAPHPHGDGRRGADLQPAGLGTSRSSSTARRIADIFLGKITKWNDNAIAAAQPRRQAAGQDIIVVHRSDGSGTSYIFTDYLSKVSPDWKEKVGKATSVNWPAGLGGKGNEGVTQQVKQTEGSIGYVELIYARRTSSPMPR